MSFEWITNRRLADYLAVALAASLPWSTSATGILAVLWILAIIPALDIPALRRVALTPAGYLPLLLAGLGAIGMLWADVAWAERFNGLSSFAKLLFVPLFLWQFSASERGNSVLVAFVASCVLLLLASWSLFLLPQIQFAGRVRSLGVPVKDYISQSAMFTICVFVIAHMAYTRWHDQRRYLSIALALMALAFLTNIIYVATSRTSLVVVPILTLVLGYRLLGWKGMAALTAGFVVLASIALLSSSYLQLRVGTLIEEVRSYHPSGTATSAGERLIFWQKSIDFIKAAPIIGHGTGSIREQFAKSAVGQTGMAAEVSVNPHNQSLTIGIQLGFVGIFLLWAMWIAHLSLFRFNGDAAWVGLVVVIQNVVGSLFNSHLGDFTHGWLYVVGVGVAGGVSLRRKQASQNGPTANQPSTAGRNRT